MLPITSTLLTAQRAPSVTPHLRVRLFDRDLGVPRLRFTRWVTGEEPDGPCAAAVPADGALLRARIDPADGALALQRVATPSVEADFEAWSTAGTVATAPGLGLAAAGTRALLAAVAADDVSVEVRESTDSGATFGSPSTVATSTGTASAVTCAVRADGSAAVVWAADDEVFHVRRTGTGSWTSPAAWSRSLATVDSLAMTDVGDYAVAVGGTDADGHAGAWTTRLGSGGTGPPGQWSPLERVTSAAPGTGVTYRASGAAVAGSPRIVLVESYDGTASGAGAFDQALLTTAVVGTSLETGAWREPSPFAHGSAYGLVIAARGEHAYLCTPGGVWHAPLVGGSVDLGPLVTEARYEATEDGERLRCRLRADGGLPAPVEVGGEVTFEAGAVTAAGEEAVPGRVLWITAVRRTREAGHATLEVEAEGAMGRLDRWRSPSQRTWAVGTAAVHAIAADLAHRAGVVLAVSGASAAALVHEPAFTIGAGERASTALRRLLSKTPNALRARGWTLTLTEPDPEAASTAAYGDDAHPLIAAGLVDGTPEEGWVRVFGDDVIGQAVAGDAVAAGGGLAVVVDRTLYTTGQAEDRATARLRHAGRAAERAWLRTLPHAAQEVGDVVEVTDAALGLDGARFRVRSVRIDLVRSPRARAEMRLGLGEV